MSRQDGGAAFPCERDYGMKLESSEGMTLRDYFAAKVMQALLSNPDCPGMFQDVVANAYLVADAMLKARES